jgi:hypothetical protein
MKILHAVPDNEDVERIRQGFRDLENSDEETQKKFWTKAGLFDEDGNIAERYRYLFPGKS